MRESQLAYFFIGIGADADFFFPDDAGELVYAAVFGEEGTEFCVQCPGSSHFVEAYRAFVVPGRMYDDDKEVVVAELCLYVVDDIL